jgi:RNA polymerase sigma-70 factor (ECF subfamily)
MMTHTQQHLAASALTSSWVRAFAVWMAADARAEQRPRPASAEERRVRADIAASLGGDGVAYARIVERYQSVIARRMTRFTRDPNAIEELTHDVFVEAYFSLRSYRATAPLEHWLQRIATRVGYRHWKRMSQNPTISFQEQAHDRPLEDGSPMDDDTADKVAAVLERLPPRDRLVLTLLYLEARSVAEAAEMAGWSQTMVKVQAYRARKKFHKLFLELHATASPRGSNDG